MRAWIVLPGLVIEIEVFKWLLDGNVDMQGMEVYRSFDIQAQGISLI